MKKEPEHVPTIEVVLDPELHKIAYRNSMQTIASVGKQRRVLFSIDTFKTLRAQGQLEGTSYVLPPPEPAPFALKQKRSFPQKRK